MGFVDCYQQSFLIKNYYVIKNKKTMTEAENVEDFLNRTGWVDLETEPKELLFKSYLEFAQFYHESQLKAKMPSDELRSAKEINQAMIIIENDDTLLYGYRQDVIDILSWVIKESENFDGI